MSKKKKLGKGKKIGIIVGCAAGAEALVGIGALIAAPFTGGATAPVAAAMFSASAKNIAIAGGAAVGGAAVGAIATKIVDSKREEKAYGNGYNDASKAYEAKFADQAKEFAEKEEAWSQTEQSWARTKSEKDELLCECLKYIEDLEKERDSLLAENKKLSDEKQELLEKLYGIRKKLSIA